MQKKNQIFYHVVKEQCLFFSFLKISIYFDRISQSLTTENTSKPFDELVDEKCRQINKNGTSHGSALHLAQWMKGQFDESVIETKLDFAAHHYVS